MTTNETSCLLEPDQQEEKDKPKHRIDIQWLRAIAILSVLVFHLDPNLLKNGYLGVDMFFVISGYLMSCIQNYSSRKELSLELLKTFYIRRIKRIIPVYLLTVLLTLVVCSFYILEYDYENLKIDTIWAMEYLTNIQSIVDQNNYFAKIHDFKFFLHTWSLSVEIQYYLISPFLLYIIYKCGKPLFLITILLMVSYTFHTITSNNSSLSFGFLFSRIWQFMFGTFVYYLQKKNDNSFLSDTTKRKSYFIILPVITIVLIIPNNKYFVRPIITILTGLLIYFGNVIESQNIIAKLVAYIGDISYSIYLIHWPIIVLIKYHLVYHYQALTFYVIIIILISVLQHELIEKRIPNIANSIVFLIITSLYILIITCIVMPHGFGVNNDTKMPLFIKTNQKLLKECGEQYLKLDSCVPDPILQQIELKNSNKPIRCSFQGNGTGTVLLTGNSYAIRQAFALINALNGHYKMLYVIAQPSCTVFSKYNEEHLHCGLLNQLPEIMKLIKPDLMIITQRLSMSTTMSRSLNNSTNDTVTVKFREYWREYSKYTRQIIIVEPHATIYKPSVASMVKLLRENQNLDDYYIPKEDWDKEVNPGWLRVQASIDQCKICSTVSIKKHFCHSEDSKCDIYDRKTKAMLFCDSSHLNSLGSRKIMSGVVKEISNKLIY